MKLPEGHGVSTSRLFVPLLAFLGLLLVQPASGQVLRGYVVDDSTRAGIEGATVTLIRGDSTIGSSISDSDGWFSFDLPESGTYQLDAQRLGYARSRSKALFVSPSETMTVEFLLRTEAIVLEPIVVTAGRGRGLSQFSGRMEEWGKGVFMTPAMIDSINPLHPADVLRGQEETWLSWRSGRWNMIPRIKTFLGVGCVNYVLDGRKINEDLWGPAWVESPLSWISGKEVIAVEYYRYMGEVPPELRHHANGCGLLVFWTSIGWEE